MLFIIIGQARGLKEQSASEGGQGKKAFKNYTEGKIFLVIIGSKSAIRIKAI